MIIDTSCYPTNLVDIAWRHDGEPFTGERLIKMMDGPYTVCGKPRRIDIAVGFAKWPRSWQVDAAGWLDKPMQGGFTREVVSHFLFLSRRLGGPLHGLTGQASFPEAGRSERRIAARLQAGDLPVTLSGAVGETAKDDHNVWMLEGDKGAVRLCDWSIAQRRAPCGLDMGLRPGGNDDSPRVHAVTLPIQPRHLQQMRLDEASPALQTMCRVPSPYCFGHEADEAIAFAPDARHHFTSVDAGFTGWVHAKARRAFDLMHRFSYSSAPR